MFLKGSSPGPQAISDRVDCEGEPLSIQQ